MWTLILPTVLLTLAIRDWRLAAVVSAIAAEVLVHLEMYLDHSLNWWIITVFTVPVVAAALSGLISLIRHLIRRKNGSAS